MSRQSNLFSFFTRTPKGENDGVVRAEEVSGNSPVTRQNSSVIGAHSSSRLTPHGNSSRIGDSDDDLTVEFDSASRHNNESSRPVGRFKRAIISSDERDKDGFDGASPKNDENDENTEPLKKRRRDAEAAAFNFPQYQQLFCGPRTLFAQPNKSNQRKEVGEVAASLISSFTFIEERDLVVAEQPEQPQKKPSATSTSSFMWTLNSENYLADEDRFPHLDYDFLQPDKICDLRGRRPFDPCYDPKTLYVPESFIQKQTPGHRQWWKLKSAHFDTIFFFKVGKFYELYHMDAVVAVETLNLNYMRGNFAHCGFPESSYSRFADQLINRGYKVARIEQVETPQQMEARCRRTQVKDFVVQREICRITSAATRTYGILEGTDERETDGVTEPDASYLMALAERKSKNDDKLVEYGVCFVDCSTGQFRLGQFVDKDDENRASLRTLLAHHRPAQLLYEKNGLSAATTAVLDTTLGVGVSRHALFPLSEFWSADQTIAVLSNDIYFGGNSSSWPPIFHDFMVLISEINNDRPAVKPESELCVRALGAVIWCLKECLIEVDLISMRLFDLYSPNNQINRKSNDALEQWWQNRSMILDGNSLSNLHVLPMAECYGSGGSRCGGTQRLDSTKFSLLSTINRCATGFGRRTMRAWICAPLCDVHVLRQRQEAVSALVNETSFAVQALELLRKVPDLERLFQRIHTLGNKHRAVAHPDGRAQLFEVARYNKRKVKDLLLAMDGMDAIHRLMLLYVSHKQTFNSVELLDRCLTVEEFTLMNDDLMHFQTIFDRKRALAEGVMVPQRCADKEYDAAIDRVNRVQEELEDYLEEQKRALGNYSLKYTGTGKNSYGLEVPESVANRVPKDYIFISKRKGCSRYTTPHLDGLKQALVDARAALATQSAEVTRRIFYDFDVRHKRWAATVVRGVAAFDCLLALARYARESGLKMCLPEFIVGENVKSFIEIRSGYHPSLVANLTNAIFANGGDTSVLNYIPNDCVLGSLPEGTVGDSSSARTMLLTGANMGGKSTLMRQVSSLVILAQIGSMVPAERMRMTPVDRIFCRIGANDRLIAGQSTFYVELAETNVILREATPHSLVLIDELGRGTSTHDGTAIACAVLRHIALRLDCRAIFSTHYHALCAMIDNKGDAVGDAVAGRELRSNVKLAHMACMVENENAEDPTEENITFLYTLAPGAALKSYGFYTAKVAGIGVDIVRRAFAASKMLMEPST